MMRLPTALGWGMSLLLLAESCTRSGPSRTETMPDQRDILETMQVAVPRSTNRVASFTNKAAAYYCAQTHAVTHPEYSWFAVMTCT
jgi:hypothetical protein